MNIPSARILLTAGICCCFFAFATAQTMEVISPPPLGGSDLARILQGNGIELNGLPNLAGDNRAFGIFKDGAARIGLDQGILLTTGRAKTRGPEVGADAIGTTLASSPTSSTEFDQDLANLAQGQFTTDVQVLTLQFVPLGDSLRVTYVWASEEYPEQNCSPLADRFGIFIQGPGFPNFTNLATVPGTTLPVGINSINDGTVGANGGDPAECNAPDGSLGNTALYNDNDGSLFFPVYDGYTDPLTARAAVTPCQPYTLKIVIGDVGDEFDDSALFLGAESFSSNGLEAIAELPSITGTIAEGCSPGNVTLQLAEPATQDISIDYELFGSAQEGTDYISSLPAGPNFTFPQDSTTFTISFEALDDGIAEGTDSIFLALQTNVCRRDTFLIRIVDDTLPTPMLRSDTTICPGDPVQLNGDVGIAPPNVQRFTYMGDSVAIDTNDLVYTIPLTVSGVSTPVVGPGVIQNICLDSIVHSFIGDLDIYLVAPGGQFLELTSDNGGDGNNGSGPDYYLNTCFSENAIVPINFPGPTAPPGAVPFTGVFLPEGEFSNLFGSPTNGTWYLIIVDDKVGDYGTFYSWSMSFSPEYSVGYSWEPAAGLDNPGIPDPIAAPTNSTNYVLSVSDSYGCITTDTVNISTLPVLPPTNISCAATTQTTITVSWTDVPGAVGYEVDLDGTGWIPANDAAGVNTHTFTGLRAGNTPYIIQVRARSATCPGEARQIICQTDPCAALGLDIQIDTARCPGVPEGGVTLSASNGILPYTYDIGVDSISPNTSGVFDNLINGIYEVTVTDSIGCDTVREFYLGVRDTVELQFELISGVLCAGDSNAVLTASVSGPDPDYIFSWDTGETNDTAFTVPAGFASLQVTGQTGCLGRDSLFVGEPRPLGALPSFLPISCQGASDGVLRGVGDGGTLPYSFTWRDDQGNVLTDTIGLPAGDYLMEITDANGCQASSPVTIPDSPPLIVSPNIDGISCFGGSNGRIQLTVSGGAGSYLFDWSTGANSQTVNNLAEGTYTVEVADTNGCFVRDTFTLVEPPLLEVSLLGVEISCNGAADGLILTNTSGGTPSYRYNWSQGFIGDTAVATNLAAGLYSVIVTDSLGCTAEASYTLQEPPPLTLNAEVQNLSCRGDDDGAVDLEVAGGTLPFSFFWTSGNSTEDVSGLPAGNFKVYVTDGNSCRDSLSVFVGPPDSILLDFAVENVLCPGEANGQIAAMATSGLSPYEFVWSTGSTDSVVSGLAAGVYQVEVTDQNDCVTVDSVRVEEPAPLAATVSSQPPSCAGFADGTVTLALSGGTAPFTFELGGRTQNSSFFPGLTAGQYPARVVDANGCTLELDSLELIDPAPIELPPNQDIVKGFADTVTLNPDIQGGQPPYTIRWNPNQSDLLSCIDCPNPQTGVGIQTGFSFTLVDANGCRATGVIQVLISDRFATLVPTGFTPNNDGQNDRLVVHGNEGILVTTFRVFNRWGELVFQNEEFTVNDEAAGWDGTLGGEPAPAGVYVWVLEARFPNGGREQERGQTTLIR